MAGEIQLNSTTFATESGGTITVSNVDSATNRQNLGLEIGVDVQSYDADTTKNDVANTFTANQIISVTDNTNAALRVTQLGTGNALVVEDETNPDSTPFVVDASGNVGIGTTPAVELEVVDTSGSSIVRVSGDASGTTVTATLVGSISGYGAAGTATNHDFVFITNNTEKMRIDSSGALILTGSTAQKASGTTWTNPSDIRLKENITNYSKGISELIQINVKQWEYNGKGGTVSGQIGLGVIANEIESVLPNTVDTYSAKLNVDDETETDIKKFDATEITWLLVNTCKEQQTIIESQQSQIDTLTARIEALETT